MYLNFLRVDSEDGDQSEGNFAVLVTRQFIKQTLS